MKEKRIVKYSTMFYAVFVFLASSCADSSLPLIPPVKTESSFKLSKPAHNKIYHAAFPHFGDTEDVVSKEAIINFERLAQKNIAWAYFSNNWFDGILFPKEEVKIINDYKRVPFIRIMPRSDWSTGKADSKYAMQKILEGTFDSEIKQWAIDARDTKIPLLVEFGTEVNGNWFSWNAEFNGKDSKTAYGDKNLYDGMERFRDAYRHIIDICNKNGAKNITWFYHIDVEDDPVTSWNTKNGYYPGDNYIDWIGVSVYGAQEKNEDGYPSFSELLDNNWNDIISISKANKPIAILEWGVTEGKTNIAKATWITEALKTITSNKYSKKIKAISYWSSEYADLKINSSSVSLAAYQEGIKDSMFTSNIIFRENLTESSK